MNYKIKKKTYFKIMNLVKIIHNNWDKTSSNNKLYKIFSSKSYNSYLNSKIKIVYKNHKFPTNKFKSIMSKKKIFYTFRKHQVLKIYNALKIIWLSEETLNNLVSQLLQIKEIEILIFLTLFQETVCFCQTTTKSL